MPCKRDEYMPLISSFFDILIYMFKELNSPHNKPHIHAVYSDERMSIAADGEVLAGRLPRKQQKYVEAWVALNENGEVIKIKG